MNSNLSQFKLLEGQVIDGKYRLIKLLGAGGFGAVFRADEVVHDRVLRQVAVKLIPPADTPEAQAKQLNELQAAVNLDHPHIIRCFAAGEFSDNSNQTDNVAFLYLVMELADYSLDSHLENGVLSGQPLYQMLAQVAEALDYLHNNGLVHQDLKPGNILWVKNVWKVSDFGTVRDLQSQSHVQTVNIAGTPLYMAPEAFRGIVLPAWDVWSLGVMSVVAATGVVPGALSEDLLPSELQLLVKGCLRLDWRKRWTAKQVLDAISAFNHSAPLANPELPSPKTLAPQQQAPKPPVIPHSSPPTPHQNYQELLPGKVPLKIIAIPAGSFLMGSPTTEGSDDERPQHHVTVPQFYLGKYPITNAQWKAVMRTEPATEYGEKFWGDRQPVVNVSWHDAQAFCQKLTQLTGRSYRLPSEAEWEYACRARSRTKYSFGSNESQLEDYAWYDDADSDQIFKRLKNLDYVFDGQTRPVGGKQPNAFGLYDMHGNVWEWCADDWHENYRNARNDGSARVTNDRLGIVRGGSFACDPERCRSACRMNDSRRSSVSDFGFRVICITS